MGDVRITVPAMAAYRRMAEIAAAHAADHQGFAPTDTADLRSAVKQAVMLLLDSELPGGTMEFDFLSKAGIVTIEARLDAGGAKAIPYARIDRFEAAAGPLVDSWKLDPEEHRLWLQKSADGISAL